MRSFTLRGALGTPAVLIAMQWSSWRSWLSPAPFMQTFVQTQPVLLVDGAVIVVAGAVLMNVLEAVKKKRF